MKRLASVTFLDVIAFLACCWVAFMVMTHGRDFNALIDQFKNEAIEYELSESD